MAITNTRITSTEPTTVFAAVGQQAITVMYICNTGGEDCTANVHVINGDDSTAAGEDNMIYNQLLITAGNASGDGDTYVMDLEKLFLEDGDLIQVEANAANLLTVTVSSFAV